MTGNFIMQGDKDGVKGHGRRRGEGGSGSDSGDDEEGRRRRRRRGANKDDTDKGKVRDKNVTCSDDEHCCVVT